MSEMKLKPCPFCGGNAILNSLGFSHSVYCKDCGANMHGVMDDEKDIVEVWNTRTHETQTTVNQYGSNSTYISGRIENLTL